MTLKSGKFPIRVCHDTLSVRDPTDLDILTENFNYTDDPHTANVKEKLEFQTQKLIGHSIGDSCKDKKYSDVTQCNTDEFHLK